MSLSALAGAQVGMMIDPANWAVVLAILFLMRAWPAWVRMGLSVACVLIVAAMLYILTQRMPNSTAFLFIANGALLWSLVFLAADRLIFGKRDTIY